MTKRPAGSSVFLVEDEVMIRMMVADMLQELGYRVAADWHNPPTSTLLSWTSTSTAR
jgi:CheY-like chemotaxis protein